MTGKSNGNRGRGEKLAHDTLGIKWYAGSVYDNPGYLHKDKFYEGPHTDPDNYGFRLLFPWEVEGLTR